MPSRSKPPIPLKRQEDVLHMLWMLTTALESFADQPMGSALDKALVNSAYDQMNSLGYTKHRPAWEERAVAKP